MISSRGGMGSALVTGAARGIGAEVAAAFGRAAVPVALLDRDASVHQTADAIATGAGRALGVVADVADARDVAHAVEHVEQELGPIVTLANVAGVLRTGPVLELTDAALHHCLAVNAVGVWNTGRVVGARMYERGNGSIVTVASNAATTPRAGMAAYSASKASAVALTRSLALELAPTVRCNIVCPGSTDTDMLRSMADGSTSAVDQAIAGEPSAFRLGIPLSRVATAADVAAAVLFFASDAASHITMQAMTVDGGATLGV